MLDRIAYRDAKRKQQNLRDREKGYPENDITDRPPVVQSTEDQD
jgi:hypothetical protein